MIPMKRQILVVEQDEKASALYELWLQDLGVEALHARDGMQAVRVLRTQQVDGIILDLDLPVMNGLTLLTQLRQRFADIPVMVVADVESTDSLLEALESGAQDYLTKPASRSLFSQKCKRTFLDAHDSTSIIRNHGDEKAASMTRILIIDDEDDLRLLLRALLESHGYECDEARTGQEGLEKIIAGSFALVLLDYHMPVLNGLQVLQALASVTSRSLPPVIMMTANVSTALHKEAMQAGVKQILSKPFELDDILLAIGRVLKNCPSPSTCSQGRP